MSPPAFNLRSVLGSLLLLLISTCIGLIAAETIVRIGEFAPEVDRIAAGANNAYELSENPVLGYVLKRNYRHHGRPHRNRIERTNSHGFRDVERAVASRGGRRIILLGDSVVAGHGISSFKQTLSQHLERLFPKEELVEVLNFGMGGYCTAGEAELLRVKGLVFRPDMVILIFVSNDFNDFNSQVGQYAEDRRTRPAWTQWLFIHSDLFRLTSLGLNLFHFRDETSQDSLVQANREAIGANNVPVGLGKLVSMSREGDFELVIGIWPTFLDEEIVEGHYSSSNTERLLIEEIASELGIPTFRIGDGMRKDFKLRKNQSKDPGRLSAKRMYTIGDGMHPNELGARVGAKTIYEFVRHYAK